MRSRARWTVVIAGVRGGKTYACAAAFLKRVFLDVQQGRVNVDAPLTGSRYRRPRYHAWICAPTYDLLKEPRRYIESLVPPEMVEAFYEGRELWLHGGILIEFKSTDNGRALVSVGLQAMWVDEADRVEADTWRGSLRTRLSDKQGWCLFSSTPYAARTGFLWQDFIIHKDDAGNNADDSISGINYITWRFGDNPHNSVSELREAKARLPERYFKREYEASLDAFVGLVFELVDSKHIVDIVPERKVYKRVIAGVDWGWNDPGTIIVIGDTGRELIVLEEHGESHLQLIAPAGERSWLSEAKRLTDKWGIEMFVCDPSRPENIVSFSLAGFYAIGANNNLLGGIRRVDEMLSSGCLTLHRSCTGLIKEMRNWAWDTSKDGHTKEKPVAGGDHRIDALRYGVMELRKYPDLETKATRNANRNSVLHT
jgi:phage terminase large subunit